MDGIINVLKPPGMTSFDVVGYLRGILRTKKIGHTGTLDPGATGVLPVCVGRATKAIEYMMEKDKLYRAELTLGVVTDTQDSSGSIIGFQQVDFTHEEIRNAILSFIGTYDQTPPMYSAVKVDGRRLYELAREGLTVERQARRVDIHSIDIIGMEFDEGHFVDDSTKRIHRVCRVLFDVKCSKGTYIRTICSDIGERLGCGGHMSFLIRLSSGNFGIESAHTIEDIREAADNGTLGSLVSEVDTAFDGYEKVQVGEIEGKKLLNGLTLDAGHLGLEKGRLLRIYSCSGAFIALGEAKETKDGLGLKTVKVF